MTGLLVLMIGALTTLSATSHAQEVVATNLTSYESFESFEPAASSQDSEEPKGSDPQMEQWEHRLAPRIGSEFHLGAHRVQTPDELQFGPRSRTNPVSGSFAGLQLGWSAVWRHTAPFSFDGRVEPSNSLRLGLGLGVQGGLGDEDLGESGLVRVHYGEASFHAVVRYQGVSTRAHTPIRIQTWIYGVDWFPALFRLLRYDQAILDNTDYFIQTHNDLGRANLLRFRFFAGPATFDSYRTSNYDFRLECTVSPWRSLGRGSRAISFGFTITRK